MTSLQHLRELRIWSAKLTEHWWHELSLCSLPNLLCVILDHCKYDGDSAEVFASFPSIGYVHLNRLSDHGLRALAQLPKLRELNASKTAITDDGVQSLRDAKLEVLDLSDCKLTDSIRDVLGSLRQLRFLGLQNTEITDHTIESLAELKELTHLDLRGTNVTDDAVFRLCQIPTLRKVDGISGSAKLTLLDELPNYGYRRRTGH